MISIEPGINIAMKVPSYQFDDTVEFYRDVIGLTQLEEEKPCIVFDFGGKKLWLDKRNDLSHAEIWLEFQTDDVATTASYLEERGVVRRDEVETLPSGFDGFWICNPAGIIHLVSKG